MAASQDALEEVRNRQAVLAQRQSELALARQQLEDTVLRSPIDGIIRVRSASAGEYRAAGTPIVTVVARIPSPSARGARARAPGKSAPASLSA